MTTKEPQTLGEFVEFYYGEPRPIPGSERIPDWHNCLEFAQAVAEFVVGKIVPDKWKISETVYWATRKRALTKDEKLLAKELRERIFRKAKALGFAPGKGKE